jgi:hypothetical protein
MMVFLPKMRRQFSVSSFFERVMQGETAVLAVVKGVCKVSYGGMGHQGEINVQWPKG